MSNSPQSSEEGEDISALEYARQSGLSCNHLAEPLPLFYLNTLLPGICDEVLDDSHLHQFEFQIYKTDERLPMTRDAAQLLAWVSKPEKELSVNPIALSLISSRGTKNRRLELPLLSSDHESDCKAFAKREGFEIKLRDIKFPLEMVDDAKDEGLCFPAKWWDAGIEIMEELKKDRISVTKDSLIYLQDAVADKWGELDAKAIWESVQIYKNSNALEPVTPPLSPLSRKFQPFEPTSSDPAMQVPIFSDPASLITEDLAAIEKKIFDQDVPTPIRASRAKQDDQTASDTYNDSSMLGDIFSPLASLDGVTTPQASESRRKKRELLKIEETLTPPGPTPIAKTVHFRTFVEEMSFPQASTPHDEISDQKFFEEAFGDAGERAMRMAEQETLIAADTTARVEVPILDFSIADPPWKVFKDQRSAAELLTLQKVFIVATLGQRLPKWPVSKLLEIKLKWNPFPHNLAKVALEEDFGSDDSVWEAIVYDADNGQTITSSSLTWKPPGLKILRDDEDDDDEIEPGQFQKKLPQDFSFLVKKRKFEIEERGASKVARNNQNPISPTRMPRKNTPKQNEVITASEILQAKRPDGDFGLLGGPFSIESALDNFLEMRGKRKQKLGDISYFAESGGNAVPPPRPQPGPGASMQLPFRASPIAKVDPLPTPAIRPLAAPPSLIVSSSLFRQRALVRELETQFPGLRIIERDFTAHNSTAWLPKSVARSPITSSLSSEADIIVSPSTGIILTTLQKIKQKPLPGQKAKSAIRDRMEKVCVRYERLIVFVSEVRTDGSTNGLDETDCQALTEFVGFTIGLDTNTIVHFVGGGDETLSKWLVASISQHSQVGACDLLEDETHWELFLRRAGMNAFAAQAIIGELKAPNDVDTQSSSKVGHFGLIAFVEMDMKQRIAQFARLCGRKLLERVSVCIDGRWR